MHMKREIMIGYANRRDGRKKREKIGKELKACNV
jgi:hypothetical protein